VLLVLRKNQAIIVPFLQKGGDGVDPIHDFGRFPEELRTTNRGRYRESKGNTSTGRGPKWSDCILSAQTIFSLVLEKGPDEGAGYMSTTY
jgi:hypothetical protein